MATAAIVVTAGCSSEPDAGEAADVRLPPTSGVFDYQLGGAYDAIGTGDSVADIDVVVRDVTAGPLIGAYNVCYVNGFQTQPDDADFWAGRPELLLRDDSGAPVVDPDWPDEYILDPSTAERRDAILAVVRPTVQRCAAEGFDAIEIDNLDTWTRFDGVDESGAHDLARAYVSLGHDEGLAVAQKNAAEAARFAHDDLGFDFAVTEECGAWDECDAYLDVYGDHVLQIEYPETLDAAGTTFADVCGSSRRAPLTILRDRDLVASDAGGHVYESCPD